MNRTTALIAGCFALMIVPAAAQQSAPADCLSKHLRGLTFSQINVMGPLVERACEAQAPSDVLGCLSTHLRGLTFNQIAIVGSMIERACESAIGRDAPRKAT